jgi:hypothetical protein
MAQQEVLSKGFIRNFELENFAYHHPDFSFKTHGQRHSGPIFRAGSIDTIDIPFSDDFSYHGPFPDRAKWSNAYVYINNRFAIRPPSLGYATFDNLNWNGNPYNGLPTSNTNILRGPSDSLMSQFIRLPFDTATYLSFYLEPRGLDLDPLDDWDSMAVFFLGKDNVWRQVWSIQGKNLEVNFKPYWIRVDPNLYAHQGFRFLFVNYSNQTGNANHWHLDNVELNVKRKYNDTIINDVAICEVQNSLLKDYYQIPWKQLKAMPVNPWVDSAYVTVNNLDKVPKNFIYNCSYKNPSNNRFVFNWNRNTAVFNNTRTTFSFPSEASVLSALSPTNDTVMFHVDWSYYVSGDVNTRNDSVRHTQLFANYIAQDDGTAEGGYGIENTKSGKVANKFTLYAADSLWAVGVFFNQSYLDVRNKPFTLTIWKSITTGTNNEVVLKSIPIDGPVYFETMNGFATFIVDTPLWLQPGDYYIGWVQNADFVLNVGVDMNYAQEHGFKPNTGVYYNVQKKWIQTFTNSGALMIRPYLGKSLPVNVSLGEKQPNPKNATIELYPNPASEMIYLEGEMEGPIFITDITGKMVFESTIPLKSIDISQFSDGIYLLRTGLTQPIYRKFMVMHP